MTSARPGGDDSPDHTTKNAAPFHVQDVRLDPVTRRVWRGEREIRFSRKEFDLLHALISRAGMIVTRDELMHDVWDTKFWTSSKTINIHLSWVRAKLDDDARSPQLITTVRGQGFRFEITARRRWDIDAPVSPTLENEADPTLENEATGSSGSSLPRLGF